MDVWGDVAIPQVGRVLCWLGFHDERRFSTQYPIRERSMELITHRQVTVAQGFIEKHGYYCRRVGCDHVRWRNGYWILDDEGRNIGYARDEQA